MRTGCVGALLAAVLVLPACGAVPAAAPGGTLSEPAATTTAPGGASTAPTGTGTPDAPTSSPSASGPTSTPSSTSSSTPTRTASTPAAPTVVLATGAKGERVRELQVRLRQLEWFAGTITGTYGSATTAAVKGFQARRGLDATGDVDTATWASLRKRTTAPTHDELFNVLRAGPAIYRQGSTGDKVRELQARLKQIGWFSPLVTGTYGSATVGAVRGFQDKRGLPVTGAVDVRTWDRLVAMTRTPTQDAKHNRLPRPSAAGLDSRCLTGRVICISKTSDSLVWVIDGKPQLRVDVRFGAVGTPTREGVFAVQRKERTWTSTIYHSSMPYAMFFSGGQAVHYSSDFAARGYAGASHGCVNVRSLAGISSLFSQVRVGDKVVVHR